MNAATVVAEAERVLHGLRRRDAWREVALQAYLAGAKTTEAVHHGWRLYRAVRWALGGPPPPRGL